MPEAGVRPGTAEDLAQVAEIQNLAPEASHWEVREYLAYDFRVVMCRGRVAGFAVARSVAGGETELLNLAVHPEFRRQGFARALLEDLATSHEGAVYLEVRESNSDAIHFYQNFGFQVLGRRPGYYCDPPDAAVVMKFRSCYCHK